MKNIKILFLLVLCGALGYHLYFAVQKLVPCREPLPYTLGTFDAKFGISKDYFLSALRDAEAVWEVPFGKDLFTYTSTEKNDTMPVNLIYDFRQEATAKLKSLGIVVENTQASYNKLEVTFKIKKAEYLVAEGVLKVRIENFNQAIVDYEQQVNSWNKKGGAPQKEYDILEATRTRLDREGRSIEAEQNRLQNMADEINALVVTLNNLAGSLNLNVDKYNTTNVARGESFEEGLYITDGSNQQIDIYEFSSRAKLVRVLAHELGHALGIDHVPDEAAIMYEFNSSKSMSLSSDDLSALKTACGVK